MLSIIKVEEVRHIILRGNGLLSLSDLTGFPLQDTNKGRGYATISHTLFPP